jgi:hypothetical protein
VPRTVGEYQKRPEFSLEGHNRVGNMGHLRSRNQTAILSVEKPIRFTSAESEASPAEHQKVVGDVLTRRLLFVRNLFFRARRLTCVIAGRFRNVLGRKSSEDVRNDSGHLWSLKTWL